MELKNRQRQRMRRRMVLILFGSLIAIATITTTVIITTMDRKSSTAKDVVVKPIYLVEDMQPVNDFAIPATIIDTKMPEADQAVFVRTIKSTATNQSTPH